MKHLLFLIAIFLISFLYALDARAGIIVRPLMNNGLVGYWNFDRPGDKNTKTVGDMSDKRNHGTLTNMDPATDWVDSATTTGRLLGQALSFDGVNDYVNINAVAITGSSPTQETFSFWVKPTTIRSQAIFESSSTLRSNTASRYVQMNANGTIRILPCDVAYSASTATALVANWWYNIIWTRNNTSNKIYINSKEEVNSAITATCTMATANNNIGTGFNLDIGRTADTNYMQGKIDEVRIYNRALSADEIKRLYNMGR